MAQSKSKRRFVVGTSVLCSVTIVNDRHSSTTLWVSGEVVAVDFHHHHLDLAETDDGQHFRSSKRKISAYQVRPIDECILINEIRLLSIFVDIDSRAYIRRLSSNRLQRDDEDAGEENFDSLGPIESEPLRFRLNETVLARILPNVQVTGIINRLNWFYGEEFGKPEGTSSFLSFFPSRAANVYRPTDDERQDVDVLSLSFTRPRLKKQERLRHTRSN
jgi:hypothetical protein